MQVFELLLYYYTEVPSCTATIHPFILFMVADEIRLKFPFYHTHIGNILHFTDSYNTLLPPFSPYHCVFPSLALSLSLSYFISPFISRYFLSSISLIYYYDIIHYAIMCACVRVCV